MSAYEVPQPILNSPFEEPKEHWHIVEGEEPEQRPGRRPAMYFYRDPKVKPEKEYGTVAGTAIELKLVNRIREQVRRWRSESYPGVTRTTLELLQWWRRDGREQRLFFAQLDAVETIIFLCEARTDFRQGIEIPQEELSGDKRTQGFVGFRRYASKMATGSGKTTVMGMLAAWSILNKVNDRSDARFSDVVLVVCPNVTIKSRLRELHPEIGEASLYRTRDLVPSHLMPLLTQGRVLVTNWHVFEPQAIQTGGVGARVNKAGVEIRTKETITISAKTTTARGKRYLTLEDLERQVAAGILTVLGEERESDGTLKKVTVESRRYVESDTALVNRILGREVGGKQNILVMNDEAHHAYRIVREERDEEEEDLFGEDEEAEDFFKEATVWVDGLDRIQKLRGINFCLDLSATPYFLGRVGQDTNRPFPWVVSDFSLIDAIESGLVKIPQLAVRDTTGKEIPGYFNIWHWILPQLTPAERGGKKASPKPEAILKYAHHPIAMLGGLWEKEREDWVANREDPRPPVFILVCKNTQIAKVLYEWLAEDKAPTGIPPVKIESFKNNGRQHTIRVDSKVVHESDSGESKNDEVRWMRLTLDTVGKLTWPTDRVGRPIYPDGFKELAEKLDRPDHPPGRDVRCIVSVGMLTEGWDCNTVTHIIGLRPFMSQLLCEQVVGRGLRRASYELGPDDKLTEEVAKVFGVPFEVIPFKSSPQGQPKPKVKRFHVHAAPGKAQYEITFPRVEGYTQAIRNRVTVNWATIPSLVLEPGRIPPEVDVKGLHVNTKGKLSLSGPGRIDEVNLDEFRARRRLQELVFDLARTLTRSYVSQKDCGVSAHVLFPQVAVIIHQYLDKKVEVRSPANIKDLFLAPYYGWIVERLIEAIRPDTSQGESPEVPRYETSRGPGSTADVDFWTSRDVREVTKSHLNYVVADTSQWEQSAAYYLDKHPTVEAFVKNSGLGFAIPYLHNGQMHDYVPDFIIRLKSKQPHHFILEIKGYDPAEEVKRAAAERWVAAVNADGAYGQWQYGVAKKVSDVPGLLQ
ncbi:MAG: DEAD/DEAH box helicase family protein [Nitrospiraceae bacterium]|jgi:type III restriction enzyme|uniref:BPTD_3080 family restriction endonuclease n=1 Tax=Nitrospira cf. moscoviensis SBR1015 TaxID=96242 RepID=UPI000A09D524|nr:DEAD/DEAH box helicase family protein [Nitrospira cf. moscoviensis SBR1015]MBY0247624.1 DEAD/DEAH box helicase family protein [Nitrospiraceae bacterium]OQW30640.1 MAG: type III restriction endonuclease subunit R [Nitrospira sp. SG-bin2]